jgi:hypothetical protein
MKIQLRIHYLFTEILTFSLVDLIINIFVEIEFIQSLRRGMHLHDVGRDSKEGTGHSESRGGKGGHVP